VPQDRERVFIVGFRDDLAARACQTFEWPAPPPGGGGTVRGVLEKSGSVEAKSCELTEPQWSAVQRSSTWQSGGAGHRFVDPEGLASTLTASYRSSFANVAQLVGPAESGRERPRFFTRRECARLMGFSDDHALGNLQCPNRAYHQLGNSVCPPLIQAIASKLLHALGLGREQKCAAAAAAEHPSQDSDVRDVRIEVPVPKSSETSCCERERDEQNEEIATPAREGYMLGTGEQPTLFDQLAALPLEQLSDRLEALGVTVRQPSAEEFVQGFKAARRQELLSALCAEYSVRATSQPRQVIRDNAGVALPDPATEPLLSALRMMDWRENVRPAVNASGYALLKRPPVLAKPPPWRQTDPRMVRRRIWELADAALRAASAKSAVFDFTVIAVSKNFRGSPHRDQNDLSVQYALSLGDYEEGGGNLCVEESEFVVRALDTRRRLVCFDGRFPHWVSGYHGERYSVIFYRSSGKFDPPTQAVHDV